MKHSIFIAVKPVGMPEGIGMIKDGEGFNCIQSTPSPPTTDVIVVHAVDYSVIETLKTTAGFTFLTDIEDS